MSTPVQRSVPVPVAGSLRIEEPSFVSREAPMSVKAKKQYEESQATTRTRLKTMTTECKPSTPATSPQQSQGDGHVIWYDEVVCDDVQPTHFCIVLLRDLDSAIEDNLGVDVEFADSGQGLAIRNIKQGLISKWNRQNPEYGVEVGDIIVEVNGVRGPEKIVDEIISASTLKLTILNGFTEGSLGSDDSDEDEPKTEAQSEKGNVSFHKAESPKLPPKFAAVGGITTLTTDALDAFTKSVQGRKTPFLTILPQWEGKIKQKLKNRTLEVAPGLSFDSTAASPNMRPVLQASFLNPPVSPGLDELVLGEQFFDELVLELDASNSSSWLHKAPWSK